MKNNENMFKILAKFFNPNLTLKDEYKNLSKEELGRIIETKLQNEKNN